MKTCIAMGVCLLLTVTSRVEAFCHMAPLVMPLPYCEGPQGDVQVGESYRHNCMDCGCTGHGLSCCGVGYNAGAFAMDGCKRVKLDKCCFQFVKTDDPSINCTKPQCPRPHENEISTTIVTKN